MGDLAPVVDAWSGEGGGSVRLTSALAKLVGVEGTTSVSRARPGLALRTTSTGCSRAFATSAAEKVFQ